jgi:threonine synthase
VLAVDDGAILDARTRLAKTGYRVEAASATVLAALCELRERGEIARGEDVVLVATGVGYGGGSSDAGESDGAGEVAPVVSRAELPTKI